MKKIISDNWQRLKKVSPTPLLDTELLLAHAMGKPREFLYSHPDHEITKTAKNKFTKFLKQRINNVPIAYIIGEKEFFGLNFIVNNNVLIPRPDTEILVEEVIRCVESETTTSRLQQNIIDMGTGSGCIAVALKKHLPKTNIIATDVSEKAITVAKQNAKLNKTKIVFYKANLFKGVSDKYKNILDIICFNPPYLTKNEAKKKNLKHEPQVALTPKSFTDLMNNFFIQSKDYINKNGQFFIEIGHKQAQLIVKIARKHYPKSQIEIIQDLGGFDRVVKIVI